MKILFSVLIASSAFYAFDDITSVNLTIKDPSKEIVGKGTGTLTSPGNRKYEAGTVINKDFAEFQESDWIAVREPGFSTAGSFIQRNGYIENSYPEGTDTSKMFHKETGYAMRILKGVEVQNCKVEMELLLMGYAAPSIFLRARVAGDNHYEAYNCVIFNFTTPQRRYQGINLWVYRNGWNKVKAIDLDIPKNQKIKYAVEIVDNQLTFFLNDKMVGSYVDSEPFPKGSIGMCSIEGPNYFYNFKFTSYDR